MTSLDQVANAILIAFALSIPFVILAGLWLGDCSRLGQAIGRRAIRLARRRHA